MIYKRYFWWLLPFFVVTSGNFSPFRVGPILPIFWLLGAYTVGERKLLKSFFLRNGYIAYIMIALVICAVFVTLNTTSSYGISGDEFAGAVHPIVYSLMSLFRSLFVIFVLIVLCRGEMTSYKRWFDALIFSYCVTLIPLYAQAILYFFFGYEVGYLFPTETGMRYGGFIGEPQTISAWLCCIFFCLMRSDRVNSNSNSKFALYSSILLALALTQSTAWILSFFIFMLTRTKWWFFLFVTIFSAVTGIVAQVSEKIFADIFIISERSVTIAAGFELFTKNLVDVLFGYGAGMTPYLITGTEIFAEYTSFDLSSLGRQTVMNSYFELICEFGLIGAALYSFLLVKACNIVTLRQIFLLLPILIGIFGVSGGFSSGYFLIGVPMLMNLSKTKNVVGA